MTVPTCRHSDTVLHSNHHIPLILHLALGLTLDITVAPMNHHLGKYPDAGVIQDLPLEILNITVVPLDHLAISVTPVPSDMVTPVPSDTVVLDLSDHPATVTPDLSDMVAPVPSDMVAPDLFDTLAFNEIKVFWGFDFANIC